MFNAKSLFALPFVNHLNNAVTIVITRSPTSTDHAPSASYGIGSRCNLTICAFAVAVAAEISCQSRTFNNSTNADKHNSPRHMWFITMLVAFMVALWAGFAGILLAASSPSSERKKRQDVSHAHVLRHTTFYSQMGPKAQIFLEAEPPSGDHTSTIMHRLIRRFMEYPVAGEMQSPTAPPPPILHHMTSISTTTTEYVAKREMPNYITPSPPQPPAVLQQQQEEQSEEIQSNAHVQRWMANYEKLKMFKKKYGTTNVTRTKDEFKTLGNWVHEQRRKYRNGALLPFQRQMLDSLDFDWVGTSTLLSSSNRRRARGTFLEIHFAKAGTPPGSTRNLVSISGHGSTCDHSSVDTFSRPDRPTQQK
ncbi:hypothetical protein PROFUN_06554 [Planoprotostelium fungivorum]|uniref:Helicase-associated domain-containing protein n=1 Tax=Planoprotostelium fungivorum TaxID=1890364 RepID=A0A2P6MRU8_9EUKA|nr:hypothetical protein PROFUN_06554 [Planoprotostelium fungivorum]